MGGFNSWWVAKNAYSGGWGQSIPQLPIPASLPKKKKKQVALKLYMVNGESSYHVYEVILLAENETKAVNVTDAAYGFSHHSCVEVKGPFKNGTILMMSQVNK